MQMKFTYGYAYDEYNEVSYRVWWVSVDKPDLFFMSFPLADKPTAKQVRLLKRLIRKYQKLKGSQREKVFCSRFGFFSIDFCGVVSIKSVNKKTTKV